MGNTSLGILAVSMSLWAVDLGAGRLGPTGAPPVVAKSASRAACQPGLTTPLDESDVEVVVCAKPLR